MDMEQLDADNPDDVTSGVRPTSDSQQPVATFIEAVVDGPNDANRLFIFTGSALVRLEMPDNRQVPGDTEKNSYRIILAKNLASGKDFRGSSTFASLSTIENDDGEDFAHAVLSASTTVQSDGSLRMEARLGVENDSALLRLSYQVSVLAHVV